MLKKICVIGHFGFGENLSNGQTIKTKIITDELCRRFGDGEVLKIDTHGGVKTLFKAPFQAMRALGKSKNVIILPAHNGLRVFAPLLVFLNHFFHRKLHYVVIGGWLPEFLRSRKRLAKKIKSFDGIYVETNTMKKALEEQSFSNVIVMPNCKNLHILDESELVYNTNEPYKLCTFSRVMREKGIEDALNAVKEVNEKLGRTVYTLDIYGQVDAEQTEWFDNLQNNFPPYVKYMGVVPFDKSVDALKNYFALLFPTRFYTEGIPGTIIDAYAAGVPVISAKWESFDDIVENNLTGIGYDFDSTDSLTDLLSDIITSPQKINDMKTQCISYAVKYLPNTAMDVLINGLSQ